MNGAFFIESRNGISRWISLLVVELFCAFCYLRMGYGDGVSRDNVITTVKGHSQCSQSGQSNLLHDPVFPTSFFFFLSLQKPHSPSQHGGRASTSTNTPTTSHLNQHVILEIPRRDRMGETLPRIIPHGDPQTTLLSRHCSKNHPFLHLRRRYEDFTDFHASLSSLIKGLASVAVGSSSSEDAQLKADETALTSGARLVLPKKRIFPPKLFWWREYVVGSLCDGSAAFIASCAPEFHLREFFEPNEFDCKCMEADGVRVPKMDLRESWMIPVDRSPKGVSRDDDGPVASMRIG
ncbi:hypothetical protein BC829DRAFT_128962 [Chytridium lagenaria]|nr:hypothetical protein BC829DRAFT_128962 [Chytridium lagenaria]